MKLRFLIGIMFRYPNYYRNLLRSVPVHILTIINIIIIIIIIISVFCPRAGPSRTHRNLSCSSAKGRASTANSGTRLQYCECLTS